MKKIRALLVLLTVAIVLTPIAIVVLQHQDNLLGIVLPPEIDQITQGNQNNSNTNPSTNNDPIEEIQKAAPKLVGEPRYNPQTNTVEMDFEVTNPIETPISVSTLQGEIVSATDGTPIANIKIKQPITINPGQTKDVTGIAQLTESAKEYLKTHVNDQNEINLDIQNLKVNIGGIEVIIDKQNIGNIQIPTEIMG